MDHDYIGHHYAGRGTFHGPCSNRLSECSPYPRTCLCTRLCAQAEEAAAVAAFSAKWGALPRAATAAAAQQQQQQKQKPATAQKMLSVGPESAAPVAVHRKRRPAVPGRDRPNAWTEVRQASAPIF